MQLSEAEADDTLYSLAGECEELFAQTHEKLKHDASGQDPAFLRLFDEYQHRFIAWTAYLGVFANKNVCLDRRLRRHPEVQDLIVRLLDVVHLSLQQLSGFATEHADQPLIDDDGEPRVGAAAAAAGDLTLDAINDALDRLNHIGITIRQSSAMRNSNTIFSRDSSESESFRQIMLICIQSLYPAASPAIQEHLMEYLASRHNEIIGKQSRQKKYGTRRPKEPSSSTQNNAALVTKEQQQPGPSPFATQSHLNGKGTLRRTVRFDLGAGIVQRTEPSTIVASLKELSSPLRPSSRKTGASSVQVSPRRYPDPPQPGENSIRTCKWCFQSLGDKFCEGTRWKLHVDKDFNPYVCLWEHCTRPKRGFSTFSAWSEHMSVEHGESWYTEAFPSAGWACIICPRGHNEFDSPKELTDHLSASHGFTSIQCEAVVDQSRTFIQRDPKHCVVCCRKVEPDPAIGDVLGKRVHDSLAFRGNQKRVRTDDGSLEVSTGPDSVISGPQPLGQPGPNTTPEPTDREKMSRHIAGHLQTLMFVLIRLMDTAEGENEPSIGDAQTSSSRALSVDSESLSREAFDEDGSPLIFSHPDTEIGQMDLDGEAPPLDQSSLEYLNRSNVLDSDSQVEYWRNHSDIANTASAQSLEKMQEYLSSQLFRRGHSPSFDVGDRCSTGFPQKRKMETHQTDPVLKTKVEKKYGQVDFERFDDVASSHMRAGYAKIGKVEIDCKFNFRKSRWGTLGPNRHPGGIVYLDLDILQPSDCRLRSATVEVILEEDRRPAADVEAVRSKCPVKFTDSYGPKSLSGPERVERTRRIKNLTPMVNVLGSGAGGLGIDTEKIKITRSGRWKFAGHITSSEGCIWYNKLRWDLQWDLDENVSETQSLHSNVIHTAFALEHNAERFYIKVNISGKLTNLSDRLKNKFKFGSVAKEQGTVTTMIEWRNGYHCPRVLDKIAESLPMAMQLENLANVSMEMPEALPASFGPAATFNPATNNPTELPFWWDQESSQGRPIGLSNENRPLSQNTEPEPTVENMETATDVLEAPPVETGGRVSYA